MTDRIRCHGCGAEVALDAPLPFRCVNAGGDHAIDHVLRFEHQGVASAELDTSSENPFLRYRRRLHSWRFAERIDVGDGAYTDIVKRLDDAIATVDGHGFARTPYRWHPSLSAFGKDETDQVSGSHKARHLAGIALQILVAQKAGRISSDAPHLAIASCGNAALAAAVVANAAKWPLTAFIPTDARAAVVDRLRELGANIEVCPRDDALPPGDPCYHRFTAAIRAGALPFCCQGSENGLTIDGGRTLGFEIAEQHAELAYDGGHDLRTIFVQVGGGALASAVMRGLGEALGPTRRPALITVQTASAYPLKRAYNRLRTRDESPTDVAAHAATHRDQYMKPWPEVGASIAHGILDDETYDWVDLVRVTLETGGDTMVIDEPYFARARDAVRAEGVSASATGAAGYAGVIAARARGFLEVDSRPLVLFTGRR